jgi:outer membrane immunogenic protein
MLICIQQCRAHNLWEKSMRGFLASLGSVFAALFLLAAPTAADDRYSTLHTSYVPAWNGIYLGASIGYSYGLSDLTHDYVAPPATRDTYDIDQDGVFATASVGFDRQLTQSVVGGLFGEYSVGDIRDRVTLATTGPDDLRFRLEDGWAAGGRVGLIHDGALWYATAGYTGINVSLADFDGTMHGYFVGAGLEKDITRNFRLKVEYRFSDYGSETLLEGAGVCCERIAVDSSVHSVQLGLSYVFGHRETLMHDPYK